MRGGIREGGAISKHAGTGGDDELAVAERDEESPRQEVTIAGVEDGGGGGEGVGLGFGVGDVGTNDVSTVERVGEEDAIAARRRSRGRRGRRRRRRDGDEEEKEREKEIHGGGEEKKIMGMKKKKKKKRECFGEEGKRVGKEDSWGFSEV